ncbi:uncharacterized protein JCM15063_001713 [Sporobolomyces koalae]|uniref:uncharacterized protein n=1 Tax=Sporobolomyces koalae TaxID=500713 RepID=UPI0031700261
MAASADTTDKSAMAKANDATDSARIGWAFLSQYYSYLNKDPARLHCFYTKRSTLIHSTEGEDTTACYGQQEIHAKIMSLAFEDCKVYISNVDSQSSAEGGIIVQVIGEMSNLNGPWRKFAQTFFLAEQPNGYFVLNDICRYIKEEGDDELSTPAPASTSAATPQPEQSAESNAAISATASASTPTTEAESDSTPASVGSVLFTESKPAQDASKEESAEPVTADTSISFGSEAAPLVNGNAKSAEEQRDLQPAVEPAPVAVEPLSAVEHKSNDASKPAATEPEAAAVVAEEKEEAEQKRDEVVEAVAAPAETTPAAPQPTRSAPPPAASSPAPAPAAAPTPTVSSAPKSWANLAASASSNKWGSFKAAAAAPKAAEPSTPGATTPTPAATAQAPASSQFTEQVQAVVHANCFVKGVVEFVTEKQLREVLTSRFGPLKELDIIRSKACAFVEFANLNDARKAIQVSLRHNDGGENGIMFETPSGDKARINVVERKPHNERPPPRPRNAGAAAAEGTGAASSSNQGTAASTTGSNSAGGKGQQLQGQQKDGNNQQQQQRHQGGRNQGGQARGQGGRGPRTGGTGGRQSNAQAQKQ